MQLDLASGFHYVPMAERDKCNMAFREADGRLYVFNRAGFGLKGLHAAFTRAFKRALSTSNLDAVTWLDGTLISTHP